MDFSKTTILITGGGSGIGKGLAEAFHKMGSQVIISGRRKELLDAVCAANPGMASFTVDMTDAHSINTLANDVLAAFPDLNAVINNAGIMVAEDVVGGNYVDIAEETILTNLLGPIRLTAALLPHLMAQPKASVLTVSSGLAFVPRADTPTYGATKAGIHSYTLSLRHQLRNSSVEVIEIVPPYVQTTLMSEQQANDPYAMPLADYLGETVALLSNPLENGEVLVQRVHRQRFAERTGNFDAVFGMVNPK